MKKLLLVFITQAMLISAEDISEPIGNKIEIKELEKTKDELLKKINGAIDDSLVALRKSNDSESLAGLEYLTMLKDQLKDTDSKIDTEMPKNEENIMKKYNLTDLAEFRRMMKNIKQENTAREGPESDLKTVKIYHFADHLKKIKTAPQRQKKIEEDIEKWMADRSQEKKKIKQYKYRLKLLDVGKEPCPNFGVEKNAGTNNAATKKKKGGRSKAKTYPCCRKCCKSSYLGCL